MSNTQGFTVVVRCADPRLEPFFVDPAKRAAMGLAPGRESLAEAYISNVGGLLSFVGAAAPRLIHDASLLSRLFGEGSARVVLTAHSECGGYIAAVGGAAERVRERQIDDVQTTADRIRAAAPSLVVATYYLDLASGEVEPLG